MKIFLLIIIVGVAAVATFGVQPQTKIIVSKDARFYVENYVDTETDTTHVRDDYQLGDYWMADFIDNFSFNWSDGIGGQQTDDETITGEDSYDPPGTSHISTLRTWPATYWPNCLSVPGTFTDSPPGISDDGPAPPSFAFQKRDQNIKQDYSFASFEPSVLGDPFEGPYIETGHLTATPHTQIVLKFNAGGMGLPKHQNVYLGSVSAVEHRQTGVDVAGGYNTPFYQLFSIPAQNITLGDLGQLDPDGILYATIPDGSTKDITPKAAGVPWFTFSWPTLAKYVLVSQVSCPALTDTNLERTTLGVGETVSLGTLPSETKWSTSGGTLSSLQGAGTVLTAPDNAGNATVTATIRKVTLSIPFSVIEPSGVEATVREYQSFLAGSVGAGMYLDVVVQPTSVSFDKIQIMEPGEATTDITGYFTSHTPPTHAGNGADAWHPVNCGNSIEGPPVDLFDHAWSGGWPIGTSGSYTWPIHPIWEVVGDTTTHSLSGWTDQVMTLSADGTMSVDKFGQNVTRHP